MCIIYLRSFIGSSELNVIISSDARFKLSDNDRGMMELKKKYCKYVLFNYTWLYNYYRKFEKLFFLGMLRSGIGTGICWIGALGFGNKRHKSGGSLRVARPIDLAKPIKHGIVALQSVARKINTICTIIYFTWKVVSFHI